MNWINRAIKQEEIDRELFRSFERRQVVDQCWRKEEGQWVIRRDPFIDGLRIPGDLLAAHHRGRRRGVWCIL